MAVRLTEMNPMGFPIRKKKNKPEKTHPSNDFLIFYLEAPNSHV